MSKMGMSKPLKILVIDSDMSEWDEFSGLIAQGHTIHGAGQLDYLDPIHLGTYDIILGPNCWRMTEEMRPSLDLAIKAAQVQAKFCHNCGQSLPRE